MIGESDVYTIDYYWFQKINLFKVGPNSKRKYFEKIPYIESLVHCANIVAVVTRQNSTH